MQSFHNPVRTRFGMGAFDSLADLVRGRRCVVITTAGMVRRGTLDGVERALGDLVAGTYAEVEPNPTVASCSRAFDLLADVDAELLIALGGGSAIDTAKAVAAQRAHGRDGAWLARHLRQGARIVEPFAPPPILAIPTTAGTGSEVTMWGTIWDEQSAVKHSISHVALYPEAALLDPALTLSVPRATTVASALDALSHAMEAIWNRAANPISDAVAVRAIALIPEALRGALEAAEDLAPRAALLSGALLAGLAISNTRTALAHSISYPLTAELGLPHGIACSLTLPELLLAVHDGRPDRAEPIVKALGCSSAEDGARELRRLFAVAGTADVVRRHVSGAEALRGVKGGYIAAGRAENFILPVDQAWAAALLGRSLARSLEAPGPG